QLRIMLQVVQRGDGPPAPRQARVGGHVVDALTPEPHLAPLLPEPLDILPSRSRAHGWNIRWAREGSLYLRAITGGGVGGTSLAPSGLQAVTHRVVDATARPVRAVGSACARRTKYRGSAPRNNYRVENHFRRRSNSHE